MPSWTDGRAVDRGDGGRRVLRPLRVSGSLGRRHRHPHDGGATYRAPVVTRPSCHGFRSVHCANFGLFSSSNGMGSIVASPYRPPLMKIPVGYTVLTPLPYPPCVVGRISRRVSPSR